MAEVDFSDWKSAEAWFETQTAEMRCTMASRAALRVVANFGRFEHPEKDRLVLSVFRAILTSAGRGSGRPADVEDLERSADSATRSAARSADSAASVARSAAYSAASAARSAVLSDSNQTLDGLAVSPVWGNGDIPDAIAAAHADFLTFLAANPAWEFWERWYQGMWEGEFHDWPLALEVATLPDHLWKGEDALAKVAEAIREIERKSVKEISPEANPQGNVIPLFDRAYVIQANMETLSEAVSLRLDAFSSMAQPNERIEFVETLKNIPDTAQRICDILAKGPSSPEVNTALAIEVGRLRSEVVKLRQDLKDAHDQLAELRSKRWYGKTSILFTGAVVSAICGAVVAISEDGFDAERRWNNLFEELRFLQNKIWPEEERLQNDLRFELPKTDET